MSRSLIRKEVVDDLSTGVKEPTFVLYSDTYSRMTFHIIIMGRIGLSGPAIYNMHGRQIVWVIMAAHYL